MGVTNAVTVDADGLAPITLVGPGAGGAATASAIVSDLADIARGVRTPPFGRPAARMTAARKAPMQRHEMSGLASDQRGRSGEPVPVILITYATTEDAVRKALAAVRRDRVISG